MASFIPWYGKKRSRLAKHEREFVEILRSQTDKARLAEAAAVVRLAHIRALKEKRQQFAPSEVNMAILAEITQSIQQWQSLSPESIIEGYRNRNQRRKMSSAVRKAAKQRRFGSR